MTTSRKGRAAAPAQPKAAGPAGAFTLNIGAMVTRLVAELGKALPAALYAALVEALLRVPVTVQQLPCAVCYLRRRAWERTHAPELQAAGNELAAALAALPPDDPRRGQLSLLEFLPPGLRPSPDPDRPNPDAVPEVSAPVTMIGGTLYCAGDAPDQLDALARPRLLVAQAGMPPGPLAG